MDTNSTKSRAKLRSEKKREVDDEKESDASTKYSLQREGQNGIMSTLSLSDKPGQENDDVPNIVQSAAHESGFARRGKSKPSQGGEERSGLLKRMSKKGMKKFSQDGQHADRKCIDAYASSMAEKNEKYGNKLGQAAEGSFIPGENIKANTNHLSFDTEVINHVSSSVVRRLDKLVEVSDLAPKRETVVNLRRKLLILDVNGLLVDIVSPPPKDFTADINILRRAIFKRPFCIDFLKFCFDIFDVGIWSSRSERILDRVVDYLLGDMKQKLLFCWDSSRCTKSEFNTLENRHKPLVFKELRKLWEKSDLNLPWKEGDYNESNTLLLDDSPYKALLNPMHTAIFPYSYRFEDSYDDKSLGPEGDLRLYLEDLVTAENIPKYIEKHPFGQSPIGERSLFWGFYSQVLRKHSLVPTEVHSSAQLIAP